MRTPSMGARAFIPLALAGVILVGSAPTAPVEASTPTTEAQQIIAIAKQQLGDPWRYGATGPGSFDCSGLVIYSFDRAGSLRFIGGGKLRSARSLYTYFKNRGLANRSNPKPGDLVIWGSGSHVGIYIGDGKAISTLTSGVRIHGVHAVTAPFTAYLHTGMSIRRTDETLISSTPTTTTTTPTTTTTTTTTATTTRYTDGSVNLRRGPGLSYSIITALRDNTALTVLRQTRDERGVIWINVKTGGLTGWVAKWLTH